jgi:hypothetical protein
MWTALFPKWKDFRVYFFSKEAKANLDRLLHEPFLLKCEKIPKRHRNFLLTFASSTEPDLFMKLFIPRPFRRNRVKSYLKNLLELKKRDVPLLEPLFLFWKNPWLALIKDEPFYGGIVFPYLKEGFLTLESAKMLLPRLVKFLFSLHEKGVYLRDTKFNNFYYTNKTGFKVFDLDGVRLYSKPLPKKMRLKELATLAMTLEWEGLPLAREIIWSEYAKLYPSLTKEDFVMFERLIALRKKRREHHLAQS